MPRRFSFGTSVTVDSIVFKESSSFARVSGKQCFTSAESKHFIPIPSWVSRSLERARVVPLIGKHYANFVEESKFISSVIKGLRLPADLQSVHHTMNVACRNPGVSAEKRAEYRNHFNNTLRDFVGKSFNLGESRFVNWNLLPSGKVRFTLNERLLYLYHLAEQEELLSRK